MHIREPRDFEAVRSQRRARHRLHKLRRRLTVVGLIVLCLVLVGYGAYLRPLPALVANTITPNPVTEQVALTWPAVGQAAIGVQGQGVMASTANQTAVPTASVAKVMTALAVLKKHPLKVGEAGPVLTLTDEDVARYNNYTSQDGSVVRVEAGEKISQYQALQAILLPSANNIADSLAVWAYGSLAQYHVVANQMAQSLGMNQSRFAGDASGLLPGTVSTAHDLVLLGQAAISDPVLNEIMRQETAVIPVVGTITNTNVFLGRGGITGIKTGNTDQAGGCYLFAAERTLPTGQKVTAVGAIMASRSLGQALISSSPLLDSFYQGFQVTTVVPKGTVVARYNLPWSNDKIAAVTAQDTNLFNWRGSKAVIKVQVNKVKPGLAVHSSVGSLIVESNYGQVTTPVILTTTAPEPSWVRRVWRL